MSLLRARFASRCKLSPYGRLNITSTRGARTKASIQQLPPPEERIELPELSKWENFFPSHKLIRNRVSVANPKTAHQVAEHFVPRGSKGKTIIEAFPGPGQLTRALLALPKSRIERIIVIEDEQCYLDYLQPLEQTDSRLQVFTLSGTSWESYDILKEKGVLDHIREVPWDAGVHPQLQFVSHLPVNVFGEQLISQYLRFIPDRHWLFRYGRIPMNFLMNEYTWQRITSQDVKVKNKLTTVSNAIADWTPHLSTELQPYAEHFHPMRPSAATKKAMVPFTCVSMVPKPETFIEVGDMIVWDFILRRMFVQRATPLNKSIVSIGPGAQILLDMTKGVVNPDLAPRELTMEMWAELVKAFKDWPFAPEDLSIDENVDNREARNVNRH